MAGSRQRESVANEVVDVRQAFGFSLALLLSYGVARAGEERAPSGGDVKKAIERGAALRKQAGFVPGAPQKYALVMLARGVRCGHAVLEVSDAKGEGGATYKLVESFKAGMADEGQTALIDYHGTFCMGPSLGLLSGELRTRSEINDTAQGKQQHLTLTESLSVKDDTLTWRITEQKGEAKEPTVKESKKLPLYGVRPIPKNALFCLMAFAGAAAKDGWQPDPKNALCVPTLDSGWELESPTIEPSWVAFDAPAPGDPKGTAVRVRVCALVGEVTAKGLEVETPAEAVWQAQQSWPLDAQGRPLAHPMPPDERITVQTSDPATLDVNAPLDLAKIGAAMKANKPKEQKKE